MNKKLFLLPLAALLLAGCTAQGGQQSGGSGSKGEEGSGSTEKLPEYVKIDAPTDGMQVIFGVYKPDNKFNKDTPEEFTGGYIYFNGNPNKDRPFYFNACDGTQVEGEVGEDIAEQVGILTFEAAEGNKWKLSCDDKYIGFYQDGTHYSLTLGEDGAIAQASSLGDYTYEFEWDATQKSIKANLGEGDDAKECWMGSSGTYWTISCFYTGKGTNQIGQFYQKRAA